MQEDAGARTTLEGTEGNTFAAATRLIVAPVSDPAREWWLDIEVENQGTIPTTGGAIVAANNVHNVDPNLVMQAFDRPVRVPGPVECSLFEARSLLDAGELVAIFPEGRRTRHGRLTPGHSGVAHLSIVTGCPIIPVGIVGTDATLPAGGRTLRRSPVGVRVGAAITPQAIGDRPTMRTRLALTHQIMSALASLSGDEPVTQQGRPPHLVQK